MAVSLGQVFVIFSSLNAFYIILQGDTYLISAVGTIGVLQALEALKIILDLPGILSAQLLLFDGLETRFRNIRLRAKDANCAVCGERPTIYKLIDYEQFCGAKANDKDKKIQLLLKEERITAEEYDEALKLGANAHILIDVRSPEEFEICHLKNSINIPLSEIDNSEKMALLKSRLQEMQKGQSETSCKYTYY